jgi:hypothetical protein
MVKVEKESVNFNFALRASANLGSNISRVTRCGSSMWEAALSLPLGSSSRWCWFSLQQKPSLAGQREFEEFHKMNTPGRTRGTDMMPLIDGFSAFPVSQAEW